MVACGFFYCRDFAISFAYGSLCLVALYYLNIERCSITSRTVQKVADALDSQSVLAQLCLGILDFLLNISITIFNRFLVICLVGFLMLTSLTGHNNPISGNSIMNLMSKLSTLERCNFFSILFLFSRVMRPVKINIKKIENLLVCRFSELNLNGLKLSKTVVDSLCQLVKSSCLSGLMLGGSSIGTVSEISFFLLLFIHYWTSDVLLPLVVTECWWYLQDGALQLTKSLFSGAQELVKLDLSYCGLTSEYITNLNAEVPMVGGILEINLGGNPVMQEVCFLVILAWYKWVF